VWTPALDFVMTIGGPPGEPETLATIRKWLLGSLGLGAVGTIGELILLGHFDEPAQWIPIVLLAASIPVVIRQAVAPSVRTVRAIQGLMVTFIAAGVLGVGLHFDGNVEFERELNPTEQGFEFIRKTVAGATPVLAPGSMVLLGLIGLAHAYRHPARVGGAGEGSDL